MEIAVCLPVYNEAIRLGPLVEALITAADYAGCDCTIFLYLDGCTDGTREVALQQSLRNSRVRLFENAKRMGKSFGLNFIANQIRRQSDCEYVVTIDSDVEFDRDIFSRCLKNAAHVGLIAPRVSPIAMPPGRLSRWATLTCQTYHTLRQAAHDRGELWFISGNFLFYRRDIYEKCYPLERIDLLNEDAFIGWQLLQRGLCPYYDPQIEVRTNFPTTLKAFIRQKYRVRSGFIQLLKFKLPVRTLRSALCSEALLEINKRKDFSLLPFLWLDQLLFFISRVPHASGMRWQRL
jgi:glycosyltransferase involved in cell wall biosynthesis